VSELQAEAVSPSVIHGFAGVCWGDMIGTVQNLHGEPRELLKEFEAVEYHYDEELAGLGATKRFLLHDRFGLITGGYIADTDEDAGPEAFGNIILALGDKYPGLTGDFTEGGLRFTMVDPSGAAQIDAGYDAEDCRLWIAYNGPHFVKWLLRRQKLSMRKQESDLKRKL
jgi:hypothetical protein